MGSELDAVFVKALKLLHSNAKDSTDHLKQMLDDVLQQYTGSGLKQDMLDLSAYSVPAKRIKLESTASESSRSVHAKEKPTEHSKDQDKRQRDKLWNDIIKDHVSEKDDLSPTVKDGGSSKDKLPVFDSKEKSTAQANSSPGSSTTVPLPWSFSMKEPLHVKPSTGDSGSDEETEVDADDFAMDLGIACIACNQFDVTPGNQLVECQECHNLYHQDCHRPPVLDSEVNDPRSVWYCTRCQRTLKKQVSKPQTKALKSASPVGKEVATAKMSKPEPVSMQPFKRVEPIKPSSTATSTRPLMGLASLAANLSGKQAVSAKQETSKIPKPEGHKTSRTGSVSLLNSESVKSGASHKVDGQPTQNKSTFLQFANELPTRPVSSAGAASNKLSSKPSSTHKTAPHVSADKRLQLMKKKAAAKQQDKRMMYR